jgi:hypothetical protein
MKLSEATLILERAVPKSSTCVTVQLWRHADRSLVGQDRYEAEFRVSILPGIGGIECSQWSGKTLDAVMAKAAAAISEQPNNDPLGSADEAFDAAATIVDLNPAGEPIPEPEPMF